MSEAQAKKVFLKQAKPFFRRFEAEHKKDVNRKPGYLRRSIKQQTFGISAKVTATTPPAFVAEFEDLFRGRQSVTVPILFTLPPGFENGRDLNDAAQLVNFKKFCEGK